MMMRQLKQAAMITAIAGALATLGACTTMGTGTGDLARGGPVTFSWKAEGAATSGDMQATLADGRQFGGPFVQMTRERFVELDPMWVGWPYGWRDWRWSGFGADQGFETVYGGKVVANLKGAGSDRMRCRFTLNDPRAGMAGGGQGQCQLSDGGTIDAVFPRA